MYIKYNLFKISQLIYEPGIYDIISEKHKKYIRNKTTQNFFTDY